MHNLTIVSPNEMLFISSIFRQWFLHFFEEVNIIKELNDFNESTTYFFYCIFLIDEKFYPYLKNNYFIYQLEQHTNGRLSHHYQPMKQYVDFFYENAIMTFDYCQQNIDFLNTYLSPQAKKPILLEVPFITGKAIHKIKNHKPIDILFCGCLNNRRKRILKFLIKRYTIKVVSNTFHEDLIPYFNQSRILLNIHFYDNAILERVRIHEGLHYGLDIVSELPCEADMSCLSFYKDVVEFVPVIDNISLRSMEPLFKTIDRTINKTLMSTKKKTNLLEKLSFENFNQIMLAAIISNK